MNSTKLQRLHQIQVEILNEIVRICEANNLQYFLIEGTLLGAIRHKGFIPWDDDLDIAMPRKDYEQFLEVCTNYLSEDYLLDDYKTNSKYWLPYAKVRKKGTIFEEGATVHIDTPKGIWVDVFPLDNVKHQWSLAQMIQALLVRVLRFNISVKQGVNIPRTSLKKLARAILSPLGIETSFKLLNRVMSFWADEECEYFVNLGSQYGYKKQTIHKSRYLPAVKAEFEGASYCVPDDYDYVLNRIYGDYMVMPPQEARVTHNPVRLDLGS